MIERYGAQRAFAGGLQDQDHAGPRTAARRRTGRQLLLRRRKAPPPHWSRSKTRPARCARWSADATTTATPSTSPPTASASPARPSRRSTSPPRSSTASPPTPCGARSRRRSSSTTPNGPERFVVHNDEGAYSGVQHPGRGDGLLGQLDLRRSGPRKSAPTRSPCSPTRWASHAAFHQPRHDDRRAHGRRHAARHGPRLRDDRPRRRPRQRQHGRGRRSQSASRKSKSGSQRLPDGNHTDRNRVTTTRILPAPIAQTETAMLETVLQYGTGKAAAIGQFAAGKTGTTSNYGDAWFVGWDSKYTVAVWVGYPEKLVPMTTDFDGGPVLGGTFPALIWHNFMTSALQIDNNRAAESKSGAAQGSDGRGGSTGPRRRGAGGQALRRTAATDARQAGSDDRRGAPQAAPERRHRPAPTRHRARRQRRRHRRPPSGADTELRRSGAAEPAARRHPRRSRHRAAPPQRPPRLAPAAAAGGGLSPGGSGSGCGSAAAARRSGFPAAAEAPGQLDRVGDADPRTRRPRRHRASRLRRGRIAHRTVREVAAVIGQLDAQRLRELAGPRAELRRASLATPRRSRISSIPSSGCSARISTAAPTPSGSQTALSIAWMP